MGHMLSQRIIFAVLGVALYLSTVAFGDEVVELHVNIGDRELNFPMSAPTDVVRCTVETNTGLEFLLLPNDGSWPTGISQKLMPEVRTCDMHMTFPTIGQSGVWTIRAYTQSDEEEIETIKRFNVQFPEENEVVDEIENEIEDEVEDEIEDEVEDDKVPVKDVPARRVDVVPSHTISIFPGNSLTLRLVNYYENLTRCIATSPDGEKFDVLNSVNNFLNDIRPFNQCGVLVRANYSHAGSWRLDATIDDDTIGEIRYFGDFDVQVRSLSTIETEPTVTYALRGAPASVRIGPSDAVTCQLRNPRGKNFPLRSGNCQANIPIVTNVHEGVWTASYSLRGRVNVVEEEMRLVAYDDDSLNAAVTTTDNGEINLLCSVRDFSFSFCQFVTPNGTVLNIFEGIGNDRYVYYGGGTQSASMLTEQTHECGITILKPDSSDHGAWKCILGTSSELSGSVLRVSIPGKDAYTDVHAPTFGENVYVVKGDKFTVKCSLNAALKYCWVGSPNGTAYSVSSTGNSPTTLRYTGMGLSLGECGAVIPAAEDTDEGEWKCGMGVYNGMEVGSIVRVNVSDTLLMPNSRNVTVHRNQAQLSCSLIPGHEDSIDYCRWIQPSGFGIQGWTSPVYSKEQYVTYSTDTSCHLEIKNVREFRNTGEWICVAGLVGSSEEVSATIQVLEEQRPIGSSSSGIRSLYFGLLLGIISTVVAGVFIVATRGKLRSIRKMGAPPKYEENHVRFPPVTTPRVQP